MALIETYVALAEWHRDRIVEANLRLVFSIVKKFIIRARFSLGSHRKVYTLQSLADRLGVSKERVRQLERRALDKLRAMAGDVQLSELDA